MKGDYLCLEKDIQDYIQDETLQQSMEICSKTEKNYGRIKTQTAYVISDTEWLEQKKDWKNLCWCNTHRIS